MTQTVRVVVVGGGISGLTAAWDLHARGGYQVTVCEASDRVGGVLAPVTLTAPDASVVVDAGAEAMLNTRPEAVTLAREAGLGDLIVHPTTTHALIASHGQLRPMPQHTVMGVPTTQTDLTGLLSDDERALWDAAKTRSFAATTGDAPVAEFLAARCGQPVVDRLVEPLLGGVYAGHATQLSMRAALPRVWDALADGTPVAQALTSTNHGTATTKGTPVFAGIDGGMHRLPAALADRLTAGGVTIRTSTPVTALTPGSGQPRWTVHAHGGHLDADAVVIALQAPHAASVLRDACPTAADELGAVPMASMALVTMLVSADQLPHRDHSGILVPPIEGHRIKAATFSSTKWAWTANATSPYVAVRASLGRYGDETTADRDDADLTHTALEDLSALLGRHLTPVASTVTRWRDALPQYTVGHHDRVGRLRAAIAATPGLAVAGSALDGVGIPACISAARAAAQAVANTPNP